MDHLADAPIANILILAGIVFVAVGLFGRIGGFIGSIFGNIEAGKNSRVLAGVLGTGLIVGGAWMHQQGDKPAASHVTPATDAAAGAPTTATSAPSTTPSTAPATAVTSERVGAGAPSTAIPPVNPARTKSNAVLAATRAKPSSTQPGTPAADREKAVPPPVSVGDNRLVATWTNVIPPRSSAVAKIEISRSDKGLDAHIWNECDTKICDYGTHPLAISGNTSTYDFTKGNRRYVGAMRVFAPDVLLLSVDSYEPGTSNHWHHNRVLTSPNLPGTMQTAFSQYLDSPGAKAFAMTPGGHAAWHLKSTTVEEATQKALQNCENHGWHDCQIILLNDEGPQ